MANSWQARRRAELRAISNREPERLIALYRFVTDMVVSPKRPQWTSFTSMIETILDHDAQLTVPGWRVEEATRVSTASRNLADSL